jgi:hypothetical protein
VGVREAECIAIAEESIGGGTAARSSFAQGGGAGDVDGAESDWAT